MKIMINMIFIGSGVSRVQAITRAAQDKAGMNMPTWSRISAGDSGYRLS
jgi:hypothetical protein